MVHSAATQTIIRNFIFGAEDSLVSTVGLLSGIAIAGVDRPTIILTGAVLICVEAFSMGVGSYLSESITHSDSKTERRTSVEAALVMLVSYLIVGLIPLAPYFFLNGRDGLLWSVIISLFGLLVLGIVGSRLSGTSVRRNTLRMIILGGCAIAIGIAVSLFIQNPKI